MDAQTPLRHWRQPDGRVLGYESSIGGVSRLKDIPRCEWGMPKKGTRSIVHPEGQSLIACSLALLVIGGGVPLQVS